MTLVWPGGLPQLVNDGYEQTWIKNIEVKPMAVGFKSTVTSMVPVSTFKVSVDLTLDRISLLWDFWHSTLQNGQQSFDWCRFDDPPSAKTYRLLEAPDISAQTNGRIRAALKLIETDDSLVAITPGSGIKSWPAGLPQSAQSTDYTEKWEGFTLRQEILKGRSMRARSDYAVRSTKASFVMSKAQRDTFVDFWVNTLCQGALRFTNPDFSGVAVTRTYKFLEPPVITASNGAFTVKLDLLGR